MLHTVLVLLSLYKASNCDGDDFNLSIIGVPFRVIVGGEVGNTRTRTRLLSVVLGVLVLLVVLGGHFVCIDVCDCENVMLFQVKLWDT